MGYFIIHIIIKSSALIGMEVILQVEKLSNIPEIFSEKMRKF